jgi:hypothetical protein
MGKSRIAVLVASVLIPPTASAQSAASWTIAAGPGLVGAPGGLVLAHIRLGVERTLPDRGFGIGIDGGWLCAARMPVFGVATLSPSVIYTGGSGVSLRGGYTFVHGLHTPVLHGSIAYDQDLGRGNRLRFELRDHVVVGGDETSHAMEVTLGWVSR